VYQLSFLQEIIRNKKDNPLYEVQNAFGNVSRISGTVKQAVSHNIFLNVIYLQLLLPVFPYPGWISPEFVSLSNRIFNLKKDYS